MNKRLIKYIFVGILLAVFLVPVITSSILDYEQKRKNEIEHQRLLKEEQDRKEAAERTEKILYLTGKFEPSTRTDFSAVPMSYSLSGNKMYLRTETLQAFRAMASAALSEGVDLKLASATRNFEYQRNLWNNKWTGVTLVEGKSLAISTPDGLTRFKKILEYSAVPSTSRHHWGTDIDLNNANPEYFSTPVGAKVYLWLSANAAKFGFCQPYSAKDASRPTGYNEEKWHWSYLPLAKDFTKDYAKLITESDIKGFKGAEYVSGQDLIHNYVLGINPECL